MAGMLTNWELTVKRLIAIIVILLQLALQCSSGKYKYDIFTLCEVVPLGSRFPELNSCVEYLQCIQGGYSRNTCESGLYYDKDSRSCKTPSSVKCFAELLPCEKSNSTLVPDPDECTGYISCKDNTEVARNACPSGEIFNASHQTCTPGKCSNDDVKEVLNICDIIPVNQKFGDFEHCNTWHQCMADGTILSGTCDENMVLSMDTGECVPFNKYEKNCARFPSSSSYEAPCNSTKSHENICSVGYSCYENNYTTIRCWDRLYFDRNRKICLDRPEATPIATCNRCEYATTQWVNSVDPECTKYTVCQDGLPVAEGSCGTNRYFDEERQSCIVGLQNLEEYRERNGACRVPT